MKTKLYLCFDVGGTNVKYGLLTAEGKFINKSSYPTRKETAEQFIDDMVNVINEITTTNQIEKIAISFPGFIDPSTGYAALAGAIDVLDGTNIITLLNQKTTLPIIIENDANCATLAEKHSGNAINCDDFICMTIGTGIGGGIFINGDILHGHAFQAGEFGLMTVNGLDDGYQNLHDIASTSALINNYKKIKKIDIKTLIEGEKVFEDARIDPEVEAMLDRWFSYVSAGVFNLVATLNPEKILIGGAISVREDLYERINDKLNQIYNWKDIKVPIEACYHHNNAGLLGALYQAVQSDQKNQIKEELN
ncbi:ROK family protein [Paraliobacillus sediminis]|uniref:ROK family protein n=1 Tax=Paraliobacillus sediminis TaxID=1885916 RepID=UPI000E3DE396|nr:ROK family protein [Paraliobacillus sediminis]